MDPDSLAILTFQLVPWTGKEKQLNMGALNCFLPNINKNHEHYHDLDLDILKVIHYFGPVKANSTTFLHLPHVYQISDVLSIDFTEIFSQVNIQDSIISKNLSISQNKHTLAAILANRRKSQSPTLCRWHLARF